MIPWWSMILRVAMIHHLLLSLQFQIHNMLNVRYMYVQHWKYEELTWDIPVVVYNLPCMSNLYHQTEWLYVDNRFKIILVVHICSDINTFFFKYNTMTPHFAWYTTRLVNNNYYMKVIICSNRFVVFWLYQRILPFVNHCDDVRLYIVLYALSTCSLWCTSTTLLYLSINLC